MVQKSEFTIEGLREYNRSSAVRWIISHCWEHRLFFALGLVGFFSAYIAFSLQRLLFGVGADVIINGGEAAAVIGVGLAVLFTAAWDGIGSLIGSLSMVMLATRVERDSRHELYISLLGKSQTFHDQQRVGDIMARATEDVRQLNFLVQPGIMFIFDMVPGFRRADLLHRHDQPGIALGARLICPKLPGCRPALYPSLAAGGHAPAHAIWRT